MIKLQYWAITLLLFSAIILAQQVPVDISTLGDSSHQQLCPQCSRSSLVVDAKNFPFVRLQATYQNVTFFTLDEDASGTGKAQISNPQYISETVPAAKARVSFYINGQIALNSSMEPCELLTDDYGSAQCELMYVVPAGAHSPVLIQQLPENAILTVRLHYSTLNPNVKPSSSTPILIKTENSNGASLFEILSTHVRDPSTLPQCLPVMIILGLLIASMQSMGKNPLSLFDITVPHLPSTKKPRMKSPSIPLNLALKNRMNARIISRIERSVISQFRLLYRRSGKTLTRTQIKQIRALFPYARLGGAKKHLSKTGPSAFASDADYFAALDKLKKMVDESGAAKTHKLTAWKVIYQGMQAREALALDMKATGAARAGKNAGRVAKINSALDYFGKRLAKPWKFFTGDTEAADVLPGIPFVERTSLVLQNWIGSRYGNIMVRRSLYKSIAAESMHALGIAKNSKFVQQNIYDNKKIGEIPRTLEQMRMGTYMMGRGFMAEYIRALVEGITNDKEDLANLSISKSRLKDVQRIISLVHAQIDEKIKTGQIDSSYRIYFENEEIIRALSKYITKNKIHLHDGLDFLSIDETFDFIKIANAHAQLIRKTIIEDGVCSKDGLMPSFDDQRAKLMDPEGIKNRYAAITGLIDYSKEMLSRGRIPLVKIGHDLAELFGTIVDVKISKGELSVDSESQRISHIRYLMDAELAKKQLFDYIIGTRILQSKAGVKLEPLSKDGALNDTWLKTALNEVSPEKIREILNYKMRSEWAARNYMTAFSEHPNEFSYEAENLKINAARHLFNAQFDKGYLNLFRNSQSDINRNFMMYESLKSLISFYNPELKWDAQGYQKWREKGATFGDIRKGVWVIDANHVISPFASEYKIDEKTGRAIGAKVNVENGYITYKLSSMAGFMGSDYAERPINASYLVRTRSGKWRPGTPTDPETFAMINQLRQYYKQLTDPHHTLKPQEKLSLSQKEVRANIGLDYSGEYRKQILKNINALQSKLDERMRLVPRESLAHDRSQTLSVRLRKQITNFMERAVKGGSHDVDARLQEWYASQAYARIALETYQNNFKKGDLVSKEVKESLYAKDRLAAARSRLNELMSQPQISSKDEKRIEQLRKVDIPEYVRATELLEAEAKRVQKAVGWVDRDVKRVADSFTSHYNVMEQTVMRDPRITYGSAYGIGPALMVGYQSGQFVGERPQMWAGYSLLPGDRIANVLARPAYWAAMAIGIHTRTFFTKMTGYPSIYHLDTERGLDMGRSQHEQNFLEAVQSLFKPWQSFDWFTRLMKKPIRRTKYSTEFGINLWEENWQGKHFHFPFTMKSAGSEDLYEDVAARFKQLGLDPNKQILKNKIGRTFRDELGQWNEGSAYTKEESQEIISNLNEYLKTSTDKDEKYMIRQQIKGIKDTFKTHSLLNKPIIRDIFKQGPYAVENLSGHDISGVGAAHRASEMVWAFHKGINQAPTPGMFYTDSDDRMHMFPFVTSTLANPLKGSALSALQSRLTPDPTTYRVNPQLPKDLPKTLDDMKHYPGVGRPIQAEAIRDVYRRETPIFLKFVEVEMERQAYQLHNSPYAFPLAPAYLLAYHMFIKKNVPSLNNAAWSSNAPKYQYEFPWKREGLTKRQKKSHQDMLKQGEATQEAQQEASLSGSMLYTCPTHGISLRVGEQCPLCRSSIQVDEEKNQPSFINKMLYKTAYNAKNWALSAASLGGTIPIGNYNHYSNTVTCQRHGIQYERGTICPLCLSSAVRSNQLKKEEAKELNDKLKNFNKAINQTYTNLNYSQNERNDLIDKKIAQKRELLTEYEMFLNIDKRDMAYKHSREYIQHQLELTAKLDKKYGYKIKII